MILDEITHCKVPKSHAKQASIAAELLIFDWKLAAMVALRNMTDHGLLMVVLRYKMNLRGVLRKVSAISSLIPLCIT